MSDFYEEDEPIEEILEAWHRGEKGLTTGPRELDDEQREAPIKMPRDVSGIRIEGCRITGPI